MPQDMALSLLLGDAGCQSQVFLMFLSDGAPSDHNAHACAHGFYVWQEDPAMAWHRNGRLEH